MQGCRRYTRRLTSQGCSNPRWVLRSVACTGTIVGTPRGCTFHYADLSELCRIRKAHLPRVRVILRKTLRALLRLHQVWLQAQNNLRLFRAKRAFCCFLRIKHVCLDDHFTPKDRVFFRGTCLSIAKDLRKVITRTGLLILLIKQLIAAFLRLQNIYEIYSGGMSPCQQLVETFLVERGLSVHL